jgi:acetylcholinesterase
LLVSYTLTDEMHLPVSHGSDIPYVFGFAYPPSSVPSPAAAEFSEQVIDYWVSFATGLDPNDGLGSERESIITGYALTC